MSSFEICLGAVINGMDLVMHLLDGYGLDCRSITIGRLVNICRAWDLELIRVGVKGVSRMAQRRHLE